MSVTKWVRWPGNEAITVRELSNLIADALYPNADSEAEHVSVGAVYMSHESEFPAAIRSGAITVRNSLTMEAHTFTHGAALWISVVQPEDVRAFLAEKGIGIRPTATEGLAAGWWDQTMDASKWWNLNSVDLDQAAMLLSGTNPDDEEADPKKTTHADGIGPKEYRWILRQLGDAEPKGKPRSLAEWLALSDHLELKRSKWIDEWLTLMGRGRIPIAKFLSPTASGTEPAQPSDIRASTVIEPAALQERSANAPQVGSRMLYRETLIVNKLVELGFNPKALPRRRAGTKWVKSEVKEALGGNGMWRGAKVFDKAWEAVRASGDIAEEPR